jgi:RNase P protein component
MGAVKRNRLKKAIFEALKLLFEKEEELSWYNQ